MTQISRIDTDFTDSNLEMMGSLMFKSRYEFMQNLRMVGKLLVHHFTVRIREIRFQSVKSACG